MTGAGTTLEALVVVGACGVGDGEEVDVTCATLVVVLDPDREPPAVQEHTSRATATINASAFARLR
jgi:hypothetical protein